jgi:hypothetical protein
MAQPFDARLTSVLKYNNAKQDTPINPYSGKVDTIASQGYMDPNIVEKKFGVDARKQQEAAIKAAEQNKHLFTQHAVMNPYARIRLTGATDNNANFLIDSSGTRPWYEAAIKSGGDLKEGYSKHPTTNNIITWSKGDKLGRTPYAFQDFVFCKWWNKIPNNRLITLRRYSEPILDNINPLSGLTENMHFPPMCTAVTYFGENTGNTLSSILKFSTGMNWTDTSANVWEVGQQNSGEATSVNSTMEGAGGSLLGNFGKTAFGAIGHTLNAFNILDNNINKTGLLSNGLPPDPYSDGPYTNRILGPVNRISSVKRREAGLKFEMSGLKIKFDYVARPIGGINSKAILLDILSNFMLMGSASAVFFGGLHRFRFASARFPAMNEDVIRDMYRGDMKGAVTKFTDKIKSIGANAFNSGGLADTLAGVGKQMWADFMNMLGNPLGLGKNINTGEKAQTATNGIYNAITQKMHMGMKVPYLTNMRALLIGEPVGDWHLTIGNPMNPIAMIGNLICTNIEVEFNDAAGLGPDDFPLEFSVIVSLEHGMPRDRDAIESMFNLGNGRIYEMPSNFIGSADTETKVTANTGNGNDGVVVNTNYVTAERSDKNYGKTSTLPNTMAVIPTLAEPRENNFNNRLPFYYAFEHNVEKIK